MGLSSLPTPSEGMLTLFIVNTAFCIEFLKRVLDPILRIGSEPEPEPVPQLPDAIRDRFRSHFKPVQFGRNESDRCAVDCRVCLVRLKAESVVNRLRCGHVFHNRCLETWLDYHHATCPLCRTDLLPLDNEDGAWF